MEVVESRNLRRDFRTSGPWSAPSAPKRRQRQRLFSETASAGEVCHSDRPLENASLPPTPSIAHGQGLHLSLGQDRIGIGLEQGERATFTAAQGWTLVAEFSDVASAKTISGLGSRLR